MEKTMTKPNIIVLCLLSNFKKCVSKKLAQSLEMFFADVGEIVDHSNMNLKLLLKLQGDEFYSSLQKQTLENILTLKDAVICCDDFFVVNNKNQKIKDCCLLVYLEIDKYLYSLENRKENLTKIEKLKINEKVFDERNQIFKKFADIVVFVDKLDEQKIVEKIISQLKKL